VERRNNSAEELLQAFVDECESLSRALDWNDRNTKLALAQHFGVPTRLLDWTLSPYVAAYFAFSGLADRRHPDDLRYGEVAIWALDTKVPIWSGDVGVEILSPPSVSSAFPGLDNPRMRNQAGKFTLVKSAVVSLEDYVTQFTGPEVALTKLTIPASEARRALADLDAMGIKATYLFPDLSGAASSAVTRVTLLGGP